MNALDLLNEFVWLNGEKEVPVITNTVFPVTALVLL